MQKNKLQELKKICIERKIPIVRDRTANLIKKIIIDKSFSSILEIGTALGYSSLFFSNIKTVKTVTSIEKNPENYEFAKSFLKSNKKIKLLNKNAFEYKTNKKFDLIFIDGPKSNQEELVVTYLNFLKDKGVMIIDNFLLKKITSKKELNKNQRKLFNKIKKFQK
jgi:predicted O-methyltransferase YrrM